jgi:Fe-S-cluster-containing dehydrogenase component
VKRRDFLTVATAAAGTATLGGCASRRPDDGAVDDGAAILVDLTRCKGCRLCETACAAANGLPEPEHDRAAADASVRDTSPTQFQVVNRYETSRGEVFVRRQCMHCVEPACAAACLTKALVKTEEGPVIWRADRCMGCRFCMISCPFDVPKFEYDSAVPRIQKCRMCFERLGQGEQPACVDRCPFDALTFGRRGELLQIAQRKICQDPDRYVSHIYGEHEAGGTGWLYVSPVAFEEIGFPTDLRDEPYPETTRDFLTAVPLALTVVPAFLLGLRQATARGDGEEEP